MSEPLVLCETIGRVRRITMNRPRYRNAQNIALTQAMSLFRLSQQEQITALAPGAHDLQFIRSLHGHDGFLVESEQLGAIVRDALGICAPPVSPP